jgi:hypothetical protein
VDERFAGFGPQNPKDDSWRHQRVRVAKLLREGLVVVRCTDLHLDHFALGFTGSGNISKGRLGNV